MGAYGDAGLGGPTGTWTSGGDKWKDLNTTGKIGRVAQTASGIGVLESKVANHFRNPAKPGRTQKEMLAADINLLQTNPEAFGLSEAERRQMVSEATEAGNTQRQAQTTQLSRDALAGQGFQQGAFVDAQRAVAEGASQDAATASTEANKLSKAMIAQAEARIKGELDAAAVKSAENAKFWAGFGLDSAEAAGSIISSFMG